jgi:hypothetical protein
MRSVGASAWCWLEAEPSSFDLAVLTCAVSLEFFVTVATDIRASCLIDPGDTALLEYLVSNTTDQLLINKCNLFSIT